MATIDKLGQLADITQKIANDASTQEMATASNDSSHHRAGSIRMVVTVTVFDEPQFILLAQRLTNETLQEEGNLSYTFAKVTETVEASNKDPATTMEYLFIELFQGLFRIVSLRISHHQP